MRVILTQNPNDIGNALINEHTECACDCDCACPVGTSITPVLDMPVAYYLELTHMCHNRCPGCGNVYAQQRAMQPPPLDGQMWGDLVMRLSDHAQHFKLTGGEPTLHPDFSAIIQAMSATQVPFTVFTTGRWEDPRATLKLVGQAETCEGLLISLHGPGALCHERFTRVPGSFKETTHNIQRAVAQGLTVVASFVIYQHNWQHIAAALDLALHLGAHHMVCNRMIGQPLPGITPTPAQLRAAIAKIESLRAEGYPIRFGNCIPQCFTPSSATGCTAGSTFATVDPWGRMRPCNHAPLIVGSLITHSVKDVWHNEKMQGWRANIPVSCTTCAAFSTCHGGCRAQALLTGQARDPLIQAPLPKVTNDQKSLSLYADLHPVGHFVQRMHKDELILVHKSQVAVVPQAYMPLVKQLDATLSLAQIADVYGTPAIDWIGALYHQGMVTWS